MKKLTIFLMSLILLTGSLTGCLGKSDDEITVATAVPSEAKILGYMYKHLIENETDVEVNVKTGFGANAAVIEAMKSGDAQLATLYTGEVFNGHFPIDEENKDPDFVLNEAQEGFAEDPWNFKWFDSHGFQNQYAFAVREDYAKEHDIDKISDLENKADSIEVGVDNAWLELDGDGYEGFKEAYFELDNINSMAISLVYDALNNEEVDIALIYTTDARIKNYNLKVIEDDRDFFPPYLASSVGDQEMLDEHPEVEEALELLVDQLDLDTMRELNGEVNLDKREPEEVAKEYLEEQNMLE